MQIVTRKAEINDLERLYKIELECFDHEAFTKAQLAFFLKTPRFISLVAEVDGELVGFIIGSIEYYGNEKFGHIYSVDVSPKYRRRGVASKLLDEVERILVKNGAETCYLEVRTDNVSALSLYKKRDYVIMEALKNYYETGVNGFRLKKRLIASDV